MFWRTNNNNFSDHHHHFSAGINDSFDPMVHQLKLVGSNKETMKLYSTFLNSIFTKLNFNFSQVGLPTKFKRMTLLKSPHVNKKAKHNFEIRFYKQLFTVKEGVVNTDCMKFLLLNKPKSLTLKMESRM